MQDSIISEGKTTTEAIEKGLKILNISKDKVDIKVLENEDKRSFFSILTPRVVKVEIKIKEGIKRQEEIEKKEYYVDEKNLDIAKKEIEKFLEQFILKLDNTLKYELKIEDSSVMVEINGTNAGYLIGYRGETLNSLQNILSAIGNKNTTVRVKILLNIEGYRQKREKTLEELAEKVAKTVLKTGKSVTLEPMSPYERKIIHNKLQENNKIQTYSIGENEGRRVVIAKINSKK